MILKLLLASLLLASLLLPACAGKEIRDGRPDWVQIKHGAIMDKNQKIFFGIGKTEGKFFNESLAKTEADKIAREEIREIFTIYSAMLVRSYFRSQPKDDPDVVRKNEELEESTKALTVKSLTDIMIVDRWIDHSDHVTYSLARLDLDRFKSNIQKSDDVKTAIRNYIRDNAEKEFERLEQSRRRIR